MSLARQIGTLTAANALYLLSQFGVLSLLAYFTDLETVGRFGFAMAVIQPLFMLMLLGLRANLATDAAGEFAFPSFVTLRALAAIALLATAVGAIGWMRPEYLLLALPLAVQKAVEMGNDLCYGAMQKSGRLRPVARSMVLRGPAATLLFGAVLIPTGSAELAFWAQTVTWTAVLLAHDLPRIRTLGHAVGFDRDPRRIWRLARISAPLGVGHFLATLQISAPRLFVEGMVGLQALAYLTVTGYFQRAAQSLFASLEQATSWRLGRLHAAGDTQGFNRLLGRLCLAAVAAGGAFCAGIWLLGAPFLRLAFGANFVAAAPLLNWIAVAIALRLVGAMLQTGLYASRRFTQFFKLQLVVLLVMVPAAWVAIDMAGLIGAGYAIAGVAALRVAILVWLLRPRRDG